MSLMTFLFTFDIDKLVHGSCVVIQVQVSSLSLKYFCTALCIHKIISLITTGVYLQLIPHVLPTSSAVILRLAASRPGGAVMGMWTAKMVVTSKSAPPDLPPALSASTQSLPALTLSASISRGNVMEMWTVPTRVTRPTVD